MINNREGPAPGCNGSKTCTRGDPYIRRSGRSGAPCSLTNRHINCWLADFIELVQGGNMPLKLVSAVKNNPAVHFVVAAAVEIFNSGIDNTNASGNWRVIINKL